MKSDFNCVFQHPSRPCKLHPNVSFQKVICEAHLEKFGCSTTVHFSDQGVNQYTFGPIICMSPGQILNTYDVVFPKREFIDKHLKFPIEREPIDLQKLTAACAAANDNPQALSTFAATYFIPPDDDTIDQYKLSDQLSTYLNQLSKTPTSEGIFQFEILRNLFVPNPTLNVKLSYQNETRPMFRNEIQDRLNALATHIRNQFWYDNIVHNTQLINGGDDTDPVDISELSVFECFLLFNMFPDIAVQKNMEISRTEYNILYDRVKGFIATRTIAHPNWLTYSGTVKNANVYTSHKILMDRINIQAPKKYMSQTADRLNPQNLYDTKCV